jgi:hypothetical protein
MLIEVKDFKEKIKKKVPQCELYPWEKFREEVRIIRGVSAGD